MERCEKKKDHIGEFTNMVGRRWDMGRMKDIVIAMDNGDPLTYDEWQVVLRSEREALPWWRRFLLGLIDPLP